MENQNDDANISKQQEGADLDTANEGNDDAKSEETVEELKTRLSKAEEIANNQRIRAEKAERENKSGVKTTQTASPKAGELSTKDVYALMDAKVPESDIIEVQEYAILKGISIAEALRLQLMKSILADKTEQRKVASASNVGGSRRSSGAMTDQQLLEKAQKGDLPDSVEEIQRLY